MKATTYIQILGFLAFIAGFSMLMWGPEKHDTTAIVVLFTGLGAAGIKPVVGALPTSSKGKS